MKLNIQISMYRYGCVFVFEVETGLNFLFLMTYCSRVLELGSDETVFQVRPIMSNSTKPAHYNLHQNRSCAEPNWSECFYVSAAYPYIEGEE